jgi:hypothetical protein
MVSTNPMASATTVRRGLELLPESASKISPSKARLVRRAVSAARARALLPFSQGEDLKGDEGSLTRLSSKILLSDLVAEHNRGGKHLELHQPVCLDQCRRCFRMLLPALFSDATAEASPAVPWPWGRCVLGDPSSGAGVARHLQPGVVRHSNPDGVSRASRLVWRLDLGSCGWIPAIPWPQSPCAWPATGVSKSRG